jgi:hypothetical protein
VQKAAAASRCECRSLRGERGAFVAKIVTTAGVLPSLQQNLNEILLFKIL